MDKGLYCQVYSSRLQKVRERFKILDDIPVLWTSFDLTLLRVVGILSRQELGPMYHLREPREVEPIRCVVLQDYFNQYLGQVRVVSIK